MSTSAQVTSSPARWSGSCSKSCCAPHPGCAPTRRRSRTSRVGCSGRRSRSRCSGTSHCGLRRSRCVLRSPGLSNPGPDSCRYARCGSRPTRSSRWSWPTRTGWSSSNGSRAPTSICGRSRPTPVTTHCAATPPTASPIAIAVLRERESRGVSIYVHEHLRPGMYAHVGGPRNTFALTQAPAYEFIAGGIGITPLIPMLRQSAQGDRPFRLTYCGRSRAAMAFLGELESYGPQVQVFARDEHVRADLAEVTRRAVAEGPLSSPAVRNG